MKFEITYKMSAGPQPFDLKKEIVEANSVTLVEPFFEFSDDNEETIFYADATGVLSVKQIKENA